MGGFFGELYLRSTRPFLSEAATRREAAFIARTLKLVAHQPVLDIGCGHGRHLAELAASGLDAWGVDFDARSLQVVPAHLRGRVVQGDLYRLPFRACFGAAYAWYATLFISDEDDRNLAALREAASVVQPGGQLLVHGHNPFAQRQEPESRFSTTLADGAKLVEETWYDLVRDVLHGQRWLSQRGKRLEGSFLVRCPHAEDHARWAQAAGLELEAIYGDATGAAYSATSPDLIAHYRKPA